MTAELNILNKHFKKMFPFVIKVDNIALFDANNILQLDMYVSPTHYAEASHLDVRNLISEYMLEKSAPLVKTILPDWTGRHLSFVLNAYLIKEDMTILDGLNLSL